MQVSIYQQSVGDRVWIDRDYNGTQDSNESNLSGVKVTLYKDGNITTETAMRLMHTGGVSIYQSTNRS